MSAPAATEAASKKVTPEEQQEPDATTGDPSADAATEDEKNTTDGEVSSVANSAPNGDADGAKKTAAGEESESDNGDSDSDSDGDSDDDSDDDTEVEHVDERAEEVRVVPPAGAKQLPDGWTRVVQV